MMTMIIMYKCEICGSTHNGKGSTCSKACSIEKGKQTMMKFLDGEEQ